MAADCTRGLGDALDIAFEFTIPRAAQSAVTERKAVSFHSLQDDDFFNVFERTHVPMRYSNLCGRTSTKT
jgi:hypothetical protein